MRRYRISRGVTHAPLLASLFCLAIGCAGDNSAQTQTAPGVPVGPSSTSQNRQAGGEAIIPSTGQAVETKGAVDIVKAEVKGGEADSKEGPTPLSFLSQEADETLINDQPYDLVAPTGLERATGKIPPYNLMTVGKVELGKQLYYDPRLSLDSTVSCASCHDPAKGWTDQRRVSVGISGQEGGRNSPTVLNTVLGNSMFWDGRSPTLEGQAQGPIQNKIEMGDQSYRQIVERLRTIPGYRDQFRKVFGTEVTLDGLAKAVACFERTALSGDSAYDRYMVAMAGDPEDPKSAQILTLEQKRGMNLFGIGISPDDPDKDKVDVKFKGRANCTACHAGDNFTDEGFHNLGVGYDSSQAKFADLGRWVVAPIGTKAKAERGAFKTPTVRDITRTAPYMHDGSEPTLEAVVEYYNKGGIKNPSLDSKMAPLNLSDVEKSDLVAFMKALTGKVVAVSVPTLPPGPDGKSPDPRAALNAPGGTEQVASNRQAGRVHQIAGLQ